REERQTKSPLVAHPRYVPGRDEHQLVRRVGGAELPAAPFRTEGGAPTQNISEKPEPTVGAPVPGANVSRQWRGCRQTRFAPGRCSYMGHGPGTRSAAGGEGLPHDAAPANPVYLAALTSLPLSSFMELVRGLHNLRSRHRGCVATIGNYDGVHAGHQAILKRLRAHATRVGLPGCVVIFEPQPREYFSPQSAPPR